MQNCKRAHELKQMWCCIVELNDEGLSDGYKYVYQLVRHSCQGRQICKTVRMPEWGSIHGSEIEESAITHSFFAAALVDAECLS